MKLLSWRGDFVQLVKGIAPEALYVIADPHQSAALVKQLRPVFGGVLLGSPAFGRSLFLEESGELAEGAIFPLPAAVLPPGDFDQRFIELLGRTADYAERQTYDAIRLIAGCILEAGFNRVRIRDALRTTSPSYPLFLARRG